MFYKLFVWVALGLLAWWVIPPVWLFGAALLAFLFVAFEEGEPR